MNTSPTNHFDVAIVGAGPVGLLLACELRLAGRSVLVIEKERDPSSPLKQFPFGLRGLTVPTVDSFDRRGLLDALRARTAASGIPDSTHWAGQGRRPGGHFAGIQFFRDKVDGAGWTHRLPGTTDTLAVPMAEIESVLASRAVALSVELRRGCAFEGYQTCEDGVIVRAGGESLRAAWLIGCDGGRSAVRKAAGILFSGTEPEFTGYSVQATLADPNALRSGRHYTATGVYTFTAPGTITMADFDGGTCHRKELSREHVEAVLRKVSGTDARLSALALATTWTDRAFQAATYRKGRVLLAGDAAHVHSPLGGQGLNLGFGDAMNLGWKLAATLRGDAPADLLDSYEQERLPVGARILDWSRAQVALMRPSRSSRALEAIVRDLIETSDGATYFAERVWGIGLRADLGETHPLTGYSAPDFELDDGTRLNEALRSGRGLLLDFDGRPSLAAVAERWSNRITYVASGTRERLRANALLVRPDGVIAWASHGGADAADAARSMARWFGADRHSPVLSLSAESDRDPAASDEIR